MGGGAAGGTAGSWLLASGAAEPLVGLIPLDPFFTMGLMAMASATLGWLLGPIVGSGVFNAWHRKVKPQMVAVRGHASAFRLASSQLRWCGGVYANVDWDTEREGVLCEDQEA